MYRAILMTTDTEQPKPSKAKIWLMELRLPFITASTIPIILGTAVAWWTSQVFLWDLFLLTLIAGVCIHLGANVANDYFDHISGTDDMNTEYIRPFSGGSRMIQLGWLSPREVLFGSFVFFGIGGLIGLYLAMLRGFPIIVLGVIGALSGFFYTAPPIRLVSRGVGELFIGLNFGILMTLGSFFVQTQQLILEPVWASIPISLLIAAILYINEFPDHKADGAAGKRTLVVRLGPQRAAKGFAAIMATVYLSVLVMIFLAFLPFYAIFALCTAPVAGLAVKNALRNYANSLALIPSYVATIQTHLLTGVLLSGAYILMTLANVLDYAPVYLAICLILVLIVYRKVSAIRPPG